jgi:hypothetical protein
MAPPLSHPPGMSFVDDTQRAIYSDASQYYGGQEVHSRSRTYSAVSSHSFWLVLFKKSVCVAMAFGSAGRRPLREVYKRVF